MRETITVSLPAASRSAEPPILAWLHLECACAASGSAEVDRPPWGSGRGDPGPKSAVAGTRDGLVA
jgi:hypothetical protein